VSKKTTAQQFRSKAFAKSYTGMPTLYVNAM
jgi:hypothetical protein